MFSWRNKKNIYRIPSLMYHWNSGYCQVYYCHVYSAELKSTPHSKTRWKWMVWVCAKIALCAKIFPQTNIKWYPKLKTMKSTHKYNLLHGPYQAKKCLRTCSKCRFRSSCECAKYHSSLCSQFIHSVVSNDSVSRQWWPWSDCRFAQLDLGLHCLHMPEDTFSHGMAHIVNICIKIFITHPLNIHTQNIRLTHCSRDTRKRVLGKQYRPRSDAAEHGIWSGSLLFANSLAIFL